jgi:putative spermidine/putrescine transport system ATP-binding protein
MTYLELHSITRRYGKVDAVAECSLAINEGELVSFLGPSGCGKTTTLRIIAGFERADQGEVHLAGERIDGVPANRRKIGMVFQSYALFPNMTVADNVGFGLRVARMPPAQRSARITEMLELVQLGGYARRYPAQLSGGQQQRVALARALALRPRLLLLDEPLSALDAQIRVALRQEIRALQRQFGITTVYVTHDQEEALSLSDRIVVMHRGRVEQIGTPEVIYHRPATRFVASFVGTLNLLDAQVTDAVRGVVQIGDQQLALGVPLSHPAGATIVLALRPEALMLGGSPPPGQPRLSGTTLTSEFLGAIMRITIRIASQTAIVDVLNRPGLATPAPGSIATLSFDPAAVTVLAADAATHRP